MINATTAENFIKQLRPQISFELAITNEKGIVIASSISDQIGTFHAHANHLILNRQRMKIFSNGSDDILAQEIIFLVFEGLEIQGTLCIFSAEEISMDTANLIKYNLDTTLDFQSRQLESQKAQQEDSKFVNALLFEYPMNASRIYALAEESQYRNNILRLPILMVVSGDYSADSISHLLSSHRKCPQYSAQDLFLRVNTGELLLLKVMDDFQPEYVKDYLFDLYEYFKNSLSLGTSTIALNLYASSPCEELADFRESYKLLRWMTRHCPKSDYPLFFQDYLADYTWEQVSTPVSANIFGVYAQLIFKQMKQDIFVETVSTLLSCNLNTAQAADKLYVHKNTLLLRIRKIKEILDIDPYNSPKDCLFLLGLCHYIRQNDEAKGLSR